MAATSRAEKTRLPQVLFNRAMMSGLTRLGMLGGAGWREDGEWFSRPGDLHRFALGDPRGDARKPVPQISDGCCFHYDTSMYHDANFVKAVAVSALRAGFEP